tara:strand:- start:14 stop:340 length:327 start_codon:yes stop_codon:yes gene_type:complete
LLAGTALADSAETLMRSRYTAYVEGDTDYLLRTWHPDHRPDSLSLANNQKWLGLKIKGVEAGQQGAARGVVEFVARFKIGGKGHRLHEVSSFVREAGRWYYTSGELVD